MNDAPELTVQDLVAASAEVLADYDANFFRADGYADEMAPLLKQMADRLRQTAGLTAATAHPRAVLDDAAKVVLAENNEEVRVWRWWKDRAQDMAKALQRLGVV